MSAEVIEIPVLKAKGVATYILTAMTLVQYAEQSTDAIARQAALVEAEQALGNAEAVRRLRRADVHTDMRVHGAIEYVRQRLQGFRV